MLVVDLYSLLPAFTLASFLAILLWPENIPYKTRLVLFMIVLGIWIVASFVGMSGYFGTAASPSTCLLNMIVGLLGWVAVLLAYINRPNR